MCNSFGCFFNSFFLLTSPNSCGVITHLLKWIASYFINGLSFKISFVSFIHQQRSQWCFCWWSDQTTRISFTVITETHVPEPPSSSFILSFVLCFHVSFVSCLFPYNLTWRCSLWQIKDSHLGSVSFPETKWEARQEAPRHAYIRKRRSQSVMQELTGYDREV